MSTEKLYINATEAAQILGVSRPTFYRIKKERNLRRVWVGRRLCYVRDEILQLASSEVRPDPSIELQTFSFHTPFDLLIGDNTFDLRRVLKIDPFGVITLYCTLSHIADSG